MKIALLNLQYDNNYGGNLQRYALMTILQRMGHDVTHLNLRFNYDPVSYKYKVYRFVKRLLKKVIIDRNTPLFPERNMQRTYVPLVFYSMAFSICCICICSFVDIRNKLFKYIGDNSLLFYLFHIAILYPIQHSIRNNYVVLSLFLFLLPFIFVFFVQES